MSMGCPHEDSKPDMSVCVCSLQKKINNYIQEITNHH